METMHSREVTELRSVMTKVVESTQQTNAKHHAAQAPLVNEISELRTQLAVMADNNRRVEASQETFQAYHASEVAELRAHIAHLGQPKDVVAVSAADAAAHHDGAMALAAICHEVAHAPGVGVDNAHPGADGNVHPAGDDMHLGVDNGAADVHASSRDATDPPAAASTAISSPHHAAQPNAATPPIDPAMFWASDVAELRNKIADFVAENVQVRSELASIDGRHAQDLSAIHEQMSKMVESSSQLSKRLEDKVDAIAIRTSDKMTTKIRELEERNMFRLGDVNKRFGKKIDAKLEEHQARFNQTLDTMLAKKIGDSTTEFSERIETRHALHVNDVADIRSDMAKIRDSVEALAAKIEARAITAIAQARSGAETKNADEMRNGTSRPEARNDEQTPTAKTPQGTTVVPRVQRSSDDELLLAQDEFLRHRPSSGNLQRQTSVSKKRQREVDEDADADDLTPTRPRKMSASRGITQLVARPADVSSLAVEMSDEQKQQQQAAPKDMRQPKAVRGRGRPSLRGGRGASQV
jgi:hypothetical protein